MWKLALLATCALAFTSCNSIQALIPSDEVLVDRQYPDGLPLTTGSASLLPASILGDNVLYVTFDHLAAMNTQIYSVVTNWSAPKLSGDLTYLSGGGNVTSIDLYVRPNLQDCTAVPAGPLLVACPLSAETGNKLGSVNATTTLQTWGPLTGEPLNTAIAARKLYLGLRVTGGEAQAGDQLMLMLKLRK